MEKVHEFNFEEADILVQSATRKKEDLLERQKATEKEFAFRNEIIQRYFTRMSCANKKKLVIRFLNNVRSLESVLHIMNFMSFGHAKIAIYGLADTHTNFIYDKLIFDHDRMLDETVLEQTIKDDVEWFTTIDDQNQVTLIIELIRRAGGNIKRGIYLPVLRKYQATLRSIKIDQAIYNVPAQKESTKKTEKIRHENYDPNHPASIEVEKQRKKWDVMINKYRSEVEKVEKKLKGGPDKPEKGGGSKGAKSKKESKKKSSKKGDKGKQDEDLDWIQLLPVWIVKEIFGYLDQKTLKNLKKTNSYYAYVVQDLLKEMKMRKKMNTAIAKMQAQIDPVKLKEAMTMKNIEERGLKLPKHINNERGATSVKLIPKKLETFMEHSLLTKAAKETGEEYFPNKLVTFPRIIKDDMLLYRYLPCFLKDINLALGARDVEEQSFITYSLSSQDSSLVISVDEETLSDW